MSTSSVDRNATKPFELQVDFSGGMDWISDGQHIAENAVRLLRNIEVRNRNANKAKGQKPFSDIEIGAFYHDRFVAAGLDSSKWLGFEPTDTTITINSAFRLVLTDSRGSPSADTFGIISKLLTPLPEKSYIEIDLITSDTITDEFLISFPSSLTALDETEGIGIKFSTGGTINKVEDGSTTDTTINWVVDNSYRIRFERLATGYVCNLVDLTTAPTTAVQLFTTSFVGQTNSHLQFQVEAGTWLLSDVLYHGGFGIGGARIAPTALKRFYRETTTSEHIVIAHGNMYSFDKTEGYILKKEGLDDTNRWKFAIFNDVLFGVNGIDAPFRYDGITVQGIGSGDRAAPIASDIEVHLQSLFMAEDNSLFRNDPGNVLLWDRFEPVVDVDAWQGDTIVGLVKLGASLYIIKTSSVWELLGTIESNFKLIRLQGSRGCVAPHSIATNGQTAFWRGIDGVYQLDRGGVTTLMSFVINPAFNPAEASEFPTTVSTKASDSVGVIHNFKYRLAVAQHSEPNSNRNNFEYVLDFLANQGQGSWAQRSNRDVTMYAVLDGRGDNNELLYVPSDTSNVIYRAEIDNGNIKHAVDVITMRSFFNIDFVGRIAGKRHMGAGATRPFLDKAWSEHMITYEPRGDFVLGFRAFTRNNTKGTQFVFQLKRSLKPKTANGSNMPLGGTVTTTTDGVTTIDESLATFVGDAFSEEKTDVKATKLTSAKNKQKGTEIWWEITQDAAVRTQAIAESVIESTVYVGLLANPGNFEPFSIKKVVIRFTEENH